MTASRTRVSRMALTVCGLLILTLSATAALPPDSCRPQGCKSYPQATSTGGYGGNCPGGQPTHPACIRDNNFDACVGAQLVVGGVRTLTLTSASTVNSYLPASGPASVLTQNYTNPPNTSSGAFGGNVVALALNLAFSNCGVSGYCPRFDSLVIWTGPFEGYTVQQLFTLANTVLGGTTSALPAGVTIAQLSAAVDTVNDNFFGGTVNLGVLVERDCGTEHLPNAWDQGDLQACYPTQAMNPAHRMTGIAWLGAGVSADAALPAPDMDTFDDGVTFLSPPWMPCEVETVRVVVTAGPNYAAYTGGLYLNAWKDGDLDCDFCDTWCEGAAPEWILQNVAVTPGTHTLTFTDPGILTLGRYEGRVRFRLSGSPMTSCPPQATDDLGEVEDYTVADLQLAVELAGGLNAQAEDARVHLDWSTASENGIHHFDVLRDHVVIATEPGAGISAGRTDYAVTDDGLENGRLYHYLLVAVDETGLRETLAEVTAVPTAANAQVTEYRLQQNYPNPFNASTTIMYHLKERVPVMLTVYDLMGRVVATLVDREQVAGIYTVAFDAGALPSGVYLYRLDAGLFSSVRKLVLMK